MKKILFVDDVVVNQVSAIEGLSSLGFDVITESSVEGGLEILGKEKIFVVLSDLNMPVKRGDLINPKAGEIMTQECAKKMTPCFIVSDGGKHGDSDMLNFFYRFYDTGGVLLFSGEERLVGNKGKPEIFRKVWEVIQEKFQKEIEGYEKCREILSE